MKFSDIEKEQWPELKPYLDTILLPVTGLNGTEEPWEAANGLEELRDLIDAAEAPFRGRIIVYPAYHYISESSLEEELHIICNRMRTNGFTYVIIAIRGDARLQTDNDLCDLVLSYPYYKGLTVGEMKKDVQRKIISIWHAKLSTSNM